MKIVRVFPERTSYTPIDDYALIGFQPLFLPKDYDEIHISCTFTWDKPFCRDLKVQYEAVQDKPVKLGGVAFGTPVEEFVQGMYVAPNIIFTTRGCNNKCPWCMAHTVEGKFRTLADIPVGNILQDNNFLQADRAHRDKVFEMLKTQRQIAFRGVLKQT